MVVTAFDIWLLLLGPVVASFVTALADRHCTGRPLFAPRSHCFECNRTVRARDLVPLVSWPLLNGRCRECGARIPVHLWLGELAGLALAALAIWWAGTPLLGFLAAAWLWCLLGLFQSDLQCQRLPDVLTAALLVFGLAIGAATFGFVASLISAVLGVAGLWLIATAFRRARGRVGLGAGDIKMMAGIGAAVGLLGVPWVTLIASVSALAMSVASAGDTNDWRNRRVAFGCHLAVAATLVLLFRRV